MPHTYAYGQSMPASQAQPMPTYGQPFFLQSAPVAAPQSPAAPPPIPTSPTVCLRMAETIAPTLTHPQLGLLHYVAFMLLTTDGAPYHADSSQAVPVLSFLVQKQLLVPSGGGYTLTNIGHAVLAHIEAQAIR